MNPADLKSTDAVILAGGIGSRLRDTIGETQKVMADLNGRPFLAFLLEDLASQGIKRAVLLTGYHSEDLEKYFRSKKTAIELVFSKEQEPLGTGGALKKAKGLIKSDPFFLMNGDSFCAIELSELISFHQKQHALATIALTLIEESRDYGTVTLDRRSRVTAFQEKVDSPVGEKFVNAGVYCLEQNIFERLPDVEKFSLERDVFPKWIGDELYGMVLDTELTDIGTPERYQEALSRLKKTSARKKE